MRTVYYRPDDLFVTFVSADSKSRATIIHPACGYMIVPCADLSEV